MFLHVLSSSAFLSLLLRQLFDGQIRVLGYSANNEIAVRMQSKQRSEFDVRLYGGLTRVLLALFRVALTLNIAFTVTCFGSYCCCFDAGADMPILICFLFVIRGF